MLICRTDCSCDGEHRGGTDTGGHNARASSNVPASRTLGAIGALSARLHRDGNDSRCGTLSSNRRQAISLVGGGLVDF
jgi:hypothetical protein